MAALSQLSGIATSRKTAQIDQIRSAPGLCPCQTGVPERPPYTQKQPVMLRRKIPATQNRHCEDSTMLLKFSYEKDNDLIK